MRNADTQLSPLSSTKMPLLQAALVLVMNLSLASSTTLECPPDWIQASEIGMGCLYFQASERKQWDRAGAYCQVSYTLTTRATSYKSYLFPGGTPRNPGGDPE